MDESLTLREDFYAVSFIYWLKKKEIFQQEEMDSDNEFEVPELRMTKVDSIDLMNNLQDVVNNTANLVAESV